MFLVYRGSAKEGTRARSLETLNSDELEQNNVYDWLSTKRHRTGMLV